jgi:hypothetical protein
MGSGSVGTVELVRPVPVTLRAPPLRSKPISYQILKKIGVAEEQTKARGTEETDLPLLLWLLPVPLDARS